MSSNDYTRRISELEERVKRLEDNFEKKRRDDNDLLYNLDESNFSEDFLKKISGGGAV